MSEFSENVKKYSELLEGITCTEWNKLSALVNYHFRLKKKEHERELVLPSEISQDFL